LEASGRGSFVFFPEFLESAHLQKGATSVDQQWCRREQQALIRIGAEG